MKIAEQNLLWPGGCALSPPRILGTRRNASLQGKGALGIKLGAAVSLPPDRSAREPTRSAHSIL